MYERKKGSGPDNIPPKLLRRCAGSLCFPLSVIFNLSLRTGIFPTRWKTSYITPIFKAGARKKIENYRGISIQATLGKLFESMVCTILTKNVKQILSVFHHGFVEGRSPPTNLVEFVNYAIGVMQSRSQVDVIYTDLSKAFDRVHHQLLVHKLSKMGIHSAMLSWIQSYFLIVFSL